MTFAPKVSIIIPVYNGSNFLAEAIQSSLNQTYQNIEVIVINDGSRDDGATRDIARSFGDAIRYIEKANGGVSTALNRGIQEMTGDYFSWLSHDDLYEPRKVEEQVALLGTLSCPERTVVYSNYFVRYQDTAITREVMLEETNPQHFRFRIAVKNDVHGCSLLIPRGAFTECGCFDEALKASQDYVLWHRMSDRFVFVHLPRSLVVGRVHGQQVGVRMSTRVRLENNAYRCSAVETLTDGELRAAMGRDPAPALLAIAKVFAARRLYPAALHCVALSLRKSRGAGSAEVLRWLPRGAFAAAYVGVISVWHSMRNLLRKTRHVISHIFNGSHAARANER